MKKNFRLLSALLSLLLLFSLTFTPSGDTVSFDLVISDIYDQNYDTVSYKVIGESAKVK